MSHGRLVLEGTVEALTTQTAGGGFSVTLETDGAGEGLDEALAALPSVRSVEHVGAEVVIESDEDVRADAAALVLARGARLLEMRTQNRTLEDIYLRYFQEAVA